MAGLAVSSGRGLQALEEGSHIGTEAPHTADGLSRHLCTQQPGLFCMLNPHTQPSCRGVGHLEGFKVGCLIAGMVSIDCPQGAGPRSFDAKETLARAFNLFALQQSKAQPSRRCRVEWLSGFSVPSWGIS